MRVSEEKGKGQKKLYVEQTWVKYDKRQFSFFLKLYAVLEMKT